MTWEGKTEYRVTRPWVYQGDCPGVSDVGARQGHYVMARSAKEAAEIAARDFPKDAIFDVQEIKTEISPEVRRFVPLPDGTARELYPVDHNVGY